jgi:hypothetical protein
MTGRAKRRSAVGGDVAGGIAGAGGENRIAEYKEKLSDEAYMAGAILRIATVLSARLAEGYADGGRKAR